MKTNAFSSLGLPDGLGSTVRIIGEVLGVLNVVGVLEVGVLEVGVLEVGVLDGVLNKKNQVD